MKVKELIKLLADCEMEKEVKISIQYVDQHSKFTKRHEISDIDNKCDAVCIKPLIDETFRKGPIETVTFIGDKSGENLFTAQKAENGDLLIPIPYAESIECNQIKYDFCMIRIDKYLLREIINIKGFSSNEGEQNREDDE